MKPQKGYYLRLPDGTNKFLGKTKESAAIACDKLGDKWFPKNKNGKYLYWFEYCFGEGSRGEFAWQNVECDLVC